MADIASLAGSMGIYTYISKVTFIGPGKPVLRVASPPQTATSN